MRDIDVKVNAYILNLMRTYDNQTVNEYELRPRINKRFQLHLRANEIRKFHIEKLIKRHWLLKIRNENGEIEYIRIGEIKHVKAHETLKDQFYAYPEEMREYMASYYAQDEIIKENWEADPDNLMTEKEALEFWTREWEKQKGL